MAERDPIRREDPSRASTGKAGNAGSADLRNPDWDAYVPEGHGRTDEQVRADVQERLSTAEDLGERTRALSISVGNGIVTLEGEVESATMQQRLLELIRAVPSVKGVEDKLRVLGK
jgi:osmotically-inducible protein OsmY